MHHNLLRWMGAAAGAGVIALWFVGEPAPRSARPEPVDSAGAARIAALEAELEQLARRTRVTERRTRRLAAGEVALSDALAGEEADPTQNGAQPVAAEAVDGETVEPGPVLEEVLAERFEASDDGSEWAVAAQEDAHELVMQVLPEGSSIHGLECRGDLCRVELQHDTAAGHRQFMKDFMAPGGVTWTGPRTLEQVELPEGSSTVAFLGRPGTDFAPDVAHVSED